MTCIRARCMAGLLLVLARKQRTDRVSLLMWPTGADGCFSPSIKLFEKQWKHFAMHAGIQRSGAGNRPTGLTAFCWTKKFEVKSALFSYGGKSV